MAATTKLADTFAAWRVQVGVSPIHVEEAIKRFERLGLQPKLSRIDRQFGDGIIFSVTIPCCACKEPRDLLREQLSCFDWNLVNSTIIELLCPPGTPKHLLNLTP